MDGCARAGPGGAVDRGSRAPWWLTPHLPQPREAVERGACAVPDPAAPADGELSLQSGCILITAPPGPDPGPRDTAGRGRTGWRSQSVESRGLAPTPCCAPAWPGEGPSLASRFPRTCGTVLCSGLHSGSMSAPHPAPPRPLHTPPLESLHPTARQSQAQIPAPPDTPPPPQAPFPL